MMSAIADFDAGLHRVPGGLEERIDALGLRSNVRDLVEHGYTIIQDAAAHAITDEIRRAILALSERTEGKGHGKRAGILLGRDPVFAEAATNPSLLVLVEYLVGRGMLLSQLLGTVRRQGTGSLGLHADNSWFPEPFPEWEIMCTACWVTDNFTEEEGATLVIPGSHRKKSHPPRAIRESLEGARAIVAPKGSICLWDGSVWHGNYARKAPGERVVLHMTYTRIGMQPIDDYGHLGDAWLENRPPALRGLLGRDLFFHSTTEANGETDQALLQNTYRLVHGPDGY